MPLMLAVGVRSGLLSEFQVSWGGMVRSCLQKQNIGQYPKTPCDGEGPIVLLIEAYSNFSDFTVIQVKG